MPRNEQALIDQVERRLAEKYSALAPDHVAAAVEHAYARFEDSRVRDFIPLLVERSAREILVMLMANLTAVTVADLGVADTELRRVEPMSTRDRMFGGQRRPGDRG